MADLKLPLTDKNVMALRTSPGGQYLARDTELGGFFVIVGARTRTYMIQADLRTSRRRETIRMKVGNAAQMTARDARARAKALLGAIASGEDPRTVRRGKPTPRTDGIPTLREAWERYRASHLLRKGRAVSTIHHYRDHVERVLAAWLDLPLSELAADPRRVADRHDELTRDSGWAMANGAMRSLRAIYNHARRTCPKLPADNPTAGVDWNPLVRRDTGMGLADLPAWFEQLVLIQNPVRREFHLLSLLSGSRPEALKQVRLEDIDLKRRVMHVRKPKGGEERAFDIPLSRPMLEAIVRLRRLAPIIYPAGAAEWLFPSDAPSGRLVEHGEKRSDLSHWGNDLRQSYRTLGQAAGLSEIDMHLLMNHSLPGVNAGYITRHKLLGDHLRSQQERLSKLILGAVVGRGRRPSPALSRWLNSTSRATAAELLYLDPDEMRRRFGSRSSMRKLEIQAARCAAQDLADTMLDAPSRRLRFSQPA